MIRRILLGLCGRSRLREEPPTDVAQEAGTGDPEFPCACHPVNINVMELLQRRDELMSPAELAFFSVLQPIVGSSCLISSKLRISDMFDVSRVCGRKSVPVGICSENIDFVLTDYETSRILCAIELDDGSRKTADREERNRFIDALFAGNALPLLRMPGEWTYHPKVLRAELLKAGLMLTDAA